MSIASRPPGRTAPPVFIWSLCAATALSAACSRRSTSLETGPGPATRPPQTAPAAAGATLFAAFAGRFTRDALALSPPAATLAGLHRHREATSGAEINLDNELDDLSPGGAERRIRFYHGTLETLDRDFPPSSLGEQER